MKKLFLIMLLCATISENYAQVSSAYKTQVESIFQVNRSYVTTGLLQDYGIFYTNVEKFNGVRSDTSYLEYTEWQSVYNSLYTYRFNTTATLAEPFTVFNQVSTVANQNAGMIVFTGLHYRYERFKSNAVSSNLVYISNNKIYDVSGRPTTPYEVKETFAIVPYRSSLNGATHRFLFKPELFFSNTGKTISSLTVDFNDGAGYRTVTANTPVTITYTSNGEKRLIFKVTYTDGTSKESHTRIEVKDATVSQNAQARYGGLNIREFQFPLAGFATPKTYQGVAGRALVTVEYTNPEQVIRKPLIVVEGFDPWRILDPGNLDLNFSFADLIGTRGPGGLLPLINFNYSGQTLSDALEENDYDLIFIDFENGTDYIQRNAFLAANVIQWVNSVKQPYNGVSQKNVVLGFSMGGLVARYALRDMEVNGITHDTRLNVSFDSPHQGANVPVAFQAAVLHLAGSGIGVGVPGITYYPESLTFGRLLPALGRGRDVLVSPAARQMLQYQVVGGGNNLAYDNSTFTSFMTEYRQLGYPVQNGIRNLVIANGSECGTDQGFAPGATFVNVNEKYRLNWWMNLLGNILSPIALLTNYPQIAIGAPFATRTDIKYEFKLTALPNQSVQEIYKFRLSIKKKILFVINIDIVLINKSFGSTSSLLALDNPAGGIYDFGRLATLPINLTLTRFSFVPTFSALDIGGGTQTITAADLTTYYSPATPPASPKNVRAANFFTNPTEGARSNEVHTQITLRNGNWLFQEIQGTPAFFSCFGGCSNVLTMTGPNSVCPSGTFSLQPQPTGLAVSWSSSNTSLLTINPTTGAATRVGSNAGAVTVIATINGGCGATTITKAVQVGGFTQSQIIVSGTAGVCPGNQYTYTASVPGGHQSSYIYQWAKPANWMFQTQFGNSIIYLLPTYSQPDYGTVTVSVNNGCGASPYAGITVYPGYGCYSYSSFNVYPNPATSSLTVELVENDSINTLNNPSAVASINDQIDATTYTVELTTDYGQPVVIKESEDGIVNIITGTLPKGLYFLKIAFKGEVETRRIVLKE